MSLKTGKFHLECLTATQRASLHGDFFCPRADLVQVPNPSGSNNAGNEYIEFDLEDDSEDPEYLLIEEQLAEMGL